MRRLVPVWGFLAWWHLSGWLVGQTVRPLPPVLPVAEPYAEVDGGILCEGPVVPWVESPVEPPATDPGRPPDARHGVFQKLVFTGQWISGGGPRGLGLSRLEPKIVLALPCPTVQWPLVITPVFAVNYMDGPQPLDVPPHTFDAYAELRWLPRLTPQLRADVAVAPGVFSDFRQGADEAVRVTGHAAAVWTCRNQAKLVAGLSYLDRHDIELLPIGGLLWNPHEDLKLELFFPQPKLARRMRWLGASDENPQDWVFVAGEFGTHVWAVQRVAGPSDELTYRDVRVLVGVERVHMGGVSARLELGYVFGRRLHYRTSGPDLDLADAVLLRGMLWY